MKTIIFPFDETFLPVLEHMDKKISNRGLYLVSPRGWALQGKKYVVAEKEYTVYKENSFLEETVDLFIVNSKLEMELSEVLETIKLFTVRKIYVLKHLTFREKALLSKMYGKEAIESFETSVFGLENEDRLVDFNVPIVWIAGTTEFTNKFEVQLSLYSQFARKGYKTGLIATKKEALLCGAKAIPDFMYNNKYTIKERIVLFNHFLKEYEAMNQPEIMFVGIPGEVIPLSKNYLGNAGEMAFMISQAISASAVVLCMMYAENINEQVEVWGKAIEKKLGHRIQYFAMTNRLLDLNETYVDNKIKYTTISPSIIENKNIGFHENIYKIFKKEEQYRLVDSIIDNLSY